MVSYFCSLLPLCTAVVGIDTVWHSNVLLGETLAPIFAGTVCSTERANVIPTAQPPFLSSIAGRPRGELHVSEWVNGRSDQDALRVTLHDVQNRHYGSRTIRSFIYLFLQTDRQTFLHKPQHQLQGLGAEVPPGQHPQDTAQQSRHDEHAREIGKAGGNGGVGHCVCV